MMDQSRYPLDQVTIEVISELREQDKAMRISQNAILSYFCRVHKLTGNVQLSEDGRELIISQDQPKRAPANGDGDIIGALQAVEKG